jgi:hypothetical protein
MVDKVLENASLWSKNRCRTLLDDKVLQWYDGFLEKYELSSEEGLALFESRAAVITDLSNCEIMANAYKIASREKLTEAYYLVATIRNIRVSIETSMNDISKSNDEYETLIIKQHLCNMINTSGVKHLFDIYVSSYGIDDPLLNAEVDRYGLGSELIELIANNNITCEVSTKTVAIVSSIRRKINSVKDALMQQIRSGGDVCTVLKKYRLSDLIVEYSTNNNFKDTLLLEYVLLKYFDFTPFEIEKILATAAKCTLK